MRNDQLTIRLTGNIFKVDFIASIISFISSEHTEVSYFVIFHFCHESRASSILVLLDTSWSCKYNEPCDLAQMDIFDNGSFILKSQCIVVKEDKSVFSSFGGGGGGEISSIFLCTFFSSFVFLCANFSPTGYIANLSTRCQPRSQGFSLFVIGKAGKGH